MIPPSPVIIVILLPLHTRLPLPQRLRQPPRQTRFPTHRPWVGRHSPATASRTRHAHRAIPRGRRRRGFPPGRTFRRRCRGCRFGSYSRCRTGCSVGNDAVGGGGRVKRRGCWRGWRRCWFRDFGGEVCRGSPALRRAIELLGEPPAYQERSMLCWDDRMQRE